MTDLMTGHHLKERGFAEKHSIFGMFLMYVA